MNYVTQIVSEDNVELLKVIFDDNTLGDEAYYDLLFEQFNI